MQVVDLELAYKGDREYLHGTDMYTEVVRVIGDAQPKVLNSDFRLVIHNMAKRQCRLIYTLAAKPLDRPENLIAEFIFSTKPIYTIAWLVETEREVNESRAYDEFKIKDICGMSDQTVTLQRKSGFTAIEELVCMTKLLHNSYYPAKRGIWLFTRLDLRRLMCPGDAGNLAVSFEKNFNNRLTRSAIIANGRSIGHIFFSLVMK